ncbi:MAG: small multi-drug export protein [Candidatus Staskawiczbacteria bacterium]|nr:small multi-drug export protein [Candidatus Staskawiczbacteria bacterium]
MSDLLQVFFLSMAPIGELRLSIPIGMAVYQLNAVAVFLVSVIGNLLPVIFLLFFLKRISLLLSEKSKTFKKLIDYWEGTTREKHSVKIQEYGAIGLALFVAVPLPMTGAWTGALLATLMELPIKKSLPAIFLGILISGIIVVSAVTLGINIEKYLDWQLYVGILIFSALVYWYFEQKNRKKRLKTKL